MPISKARLLAQEQRKQEKDYSLRVPQARVLKALLPEFPEDKPREWPYLTRAVLARRSGYTEISGSITRAINGIRAGSSSGEQQTGLIERGFVEVIILDIMGTEETNYRITHEGIKAIQRYLAEDNTLPEVRDAEASTNRRYKEE